MTFADLEWVSVLLRAMAYVGTIAVAGSVLARASLRLAPAIAAINWQIGVGSLILLVCEPLRYIMFQLSIAQGDWAMAFDPAMRWMAVETPLGQAAIVRLVGTIGVLIGFVWRPLAIAGALVVIVSYLIEGHTVSSEDRSLLAVLLFVHLVVAHWWLGALIPLRKLLSGIDESACARAIEDFGRKAIFAVGLLVAAGATILVQLTNWKLDPTSAYQQGFALKLGVFAAILGLAATNKLLLTPLLVSNPDVGRTKLSRSIGVETFVAALILLATAAATSFPPAVLQ